MNQAFYNFLADYGYGVVGTFILLIIVAGVFSEIAELYPPKKILNFSIGLIFAVSGLVVGALSFAVDLQQPWHEETIPVEKYVKLANGDYNVIAKGKKYKVLSDRVEKKLKATEEKNKDVEMKLKYYQMNKGYKDMGEKPDDELIIYHYKTWKKVK